MVNYTGYIITFLLTITIMIIVMILVVFVIYEILRKKFLNNFNINLIDYCNALTLPIVYENPSIPIPSAGTYNQTTANSLLEVCYNTSSYNCSPDIGFVYPPEFTSSVFLSDKNVIYGIIYYNETKMVIAFTGSLLLSQWSTDLKYSQVFPSGISGVSANALVHEGFYNAYKFCQGQINSLIKSNNFTDIMVTGHSLGGALSTLCALDLFSNIEIVLNSKTHYSFASPRVGNNEFVENYNSLVQGIRVNNTEDIIPQFPLIKMGNNIYEHVGVNVPFTYSYGNNKENHMEAYKNYMPSCPLNVGTCS